MNRQEPPLDLYRGCDPLEIPAYTVVEAAHYLWLPHRTLQGWVHGYSFGAARTRRRMPAVIPVDAASGLLTFADLLELHVLAALRREHGVTMQNARRARVYLQDKWSSPHPLIDQEMETDGTHIFVRKLGGALINASRDGRLAIEEVIATRLERISRDRRGLAVRLFPFTRKNLVERPDAPRLVSIDPRLVFGRPAIAGTRVPTAEVADRFWAGDSLDTLTAEYDRSPEEIGEAIRYEWWRAA
jgi:uncharacterized protein (DUF433 family)